MNASKALTTAMLATAMGISSGCTTHATRTASPAYENGTYRGAFIDEGIIQVNVQITLEDGIVTAASFRHLVGAVTEYNLDTTDEPQRSVVAQYEEALQYLVGKRLADHLDDLYRPQDVITREVDGYTQATVRANKIISAIRDALNRGIYEY